MYQKAKNSWIKHIDFVILDILCLQVLFSWHISSDTGI